MTLGRKSSRPAQLQAGGLGCAMKSAHCALVTTGRRKGEWILADPGGAHLTGRAVLQ